MIKEKNIAFILLSSTVLVVIWVIFGFYHTSVTSTLDNDLTQKIQPIRPNFSKTAIQAIVKRNQTSLTYELDANATRRNQSSASGTLEEDVLQKVEAPQPNSSPTIEPIAAPTTTVPEEIELEGE